ncbi:hypothetical protein D9M72_649120 [compost metagenome]
MLRIIEEKIDRASEHVAILHYARAAILYKPLEGFTEILDILARQNCCAHHGRFKRVMPAFLGQ